MKLRRPHTVLSGGQTGVDRAALDAAIELRIPHAGWCPKGRRAEDGPLARHYNLKETPSEAYEERTEWNVRDSDGTLILAPAPLEGGTKLTRQFAVKHKKPYLVVNPDEKGGLQKARKWLISNNVRVMNVAGPRASKQPLLYVHSRAFLKTLLLPSGPEK